MPPSNSGGALRKVAPLVFCGCHKNSGTHSGGCPPVIWSLKVGALRIVGVNSNSEEPPINRMGIFGK